MTSISVKSHYRAVYGALQFEGQLRSRPRLHHGAWICEVAVNDPPRAMTFRLGHLERLEADGVDLLKEAREAGWSTAVAANTREVALWSARDRAAEILHRSGADDAHSRARVLEQGPTEADWQVLQHNLGGPPDALERAVFETEFRNALRAGAPASERPANRSKSR